MTRPKTEQELRTWLKDDLANGKMSVDGPQSDAEIDAMPLSEVIGNLNNNGPTGGVDGVSFDGAVYEPADFD